MESVEPTPEFKRKFNTWMSGAQDIIDKHNKEHEFAMGEPLTYKEGKRYIKVIQKDSVFCFVEIDTGDDLKAASWSAPAKHARGNIFDEHNGLKNITPYGTTYLRG